MTETERVTRAWTPAQEALSIGWLLDGLHWASTSLREEDRSEDWIARAVGPGGEEREFRSADPVDALLGLARAIGEPDPN
jgi:hypothetical protein